MIERQRRERQEKPSVEQRSRGLTESKPCAILTVVKKEREGKDYGKDNNSKRLNRTA